MGTFDDIGSWYRKQGAPFTLGLLASLIVIPVALATTRFSFAPDFVVYSGSFRPWTFFTYPWIYNPFSSGMGLIGFVFLLIWLFQTGVSLEREMGTARIAAFWFGATAIGGLSFWLAAGAIRMPATLFQPFIPFAAQTVAWCTRNRSAQIMVYGIFPLNAAIIGWGAAIATFLGYGLPLAVLGIAAVVPLGVAFLFASDRIPGLPYSSGGIGPRPGRRVSPKEKEHTTRGQVAYDQSYFDEVKRREQDRAEKERLKKLLGEDDKEP